LRIIRQSLEPDSLLPNASLEVLVPSAHAGRDALTGRCQLPAAPASTFICRPRVPSKRITSANSSLRFYAVEADRCSPACGNCEKALDASTYPLIQAQSRRCHRAVVEVSRRRQSCQRKVHHSQPLADQPRQTASIGPFSACKSCAAAFSFNAAFRYSQPRTARPGRAVSRPAALLGFSCPFAGLIPVVG